LAKYGWRFCLSFDFEMSISVHHHMAVLRPARLMQTNIDDPSVCERTMILLIHRAFSLIWETAQKPMVVALIRSDNRFKLRMRVMTVSNGHTNAIVSPPPK
jgi:hypothetical protein